MFHLIALLWRPARASSWTSLGTTTPLFAAADTGPYGRQPYTQQRLTGQAVLDPFVINVLSAGFPEIGLMSQTRGWPFHSCDVTERLTRAQVEGKVLISSFIAPLHCTLFRSWESLTASDRFFTDVAALGATGVVSVMPMFGTRFACAATYSKHAPGVPPGGIPYFCISKLSFAAIQSAIASYAVGVLLLNSNQTAIAATPIVVGSVDLVHDWVPLDHLRSTGSYLYFVLLFVWSCAIVKF